MYTLKKKEHKRLLKKKKKVQLVEDDEPTHLNHESEGFLFEEGDIMEEDWFGLYHTVQWFVSLGPEIFF